MPVPQEVGPESAINILAKIQQDQQLWEEAGMPEVITYLRGCKGLVVPMVFKEVLNL